MADPKRLYEYEDFFRLIRAGNTLYVDEPIGWDKVSIKASRDKDYYGFNYQFIDGTTTLTFIEREGAELIRQVYQQEGGDGYILFEYGFRLNGVPTVPFSGRVNLNTFNDSSDGVQVQIEKLSFDGLLRTRSETKVSLNQTTDFDGNPVTPPTPIAITLHSKVLRKQSILMPADAQNQVDGGTQDISTTYYIQPDTSTVSTQEIETVTGQPQAITKASPQSEQRFQLQPKEAGPTSFSWAADYLFKIDPSQIGTGPIGGWSLTPQILVVRNGSTIYSFSGPVGSGTTQSKGLNYQHTFTMSGSYDLQVDDEVYFQVLVGIQNNAIRTLTVSGWKGNITISQDTQTSPSFCRGYRMLDLANFIVQCMTGQANSVVSSFLSQSGCGYHYMITNGYQIRNFDNLNRPLQLSWRDLLEGMAPIWNLAAQMTENSDGEDIIRIEQADYFFNPLQVILEIAEVQDGYEEEHNKEITYNEVELGYTKYQDSGTNSLDEFNTSHKWLLPIQSYKQAYSRKSKFIASGYQIESVRREQFKNNPSASMGSDDDLFIIAIAEGSADYPDTLFGFTNSGYVSFNRRIGMRAGDQFTINKNNGLNNGTVFTVDGKFNDGQDSYQISPNPVNDSGTGLLSIILVNPAAERDQAFSTVQGVLSPETSYNLRLSPARLLFNHATLLNPCLTLKSDSAIVQTTEIKNNGDLQTQFAASAACQLIDNNFLLKESQDITLSQLQSRAQLFTGVVCNFKAIVTYDQIQAVMRSLKGLESNSDKNYGVISFPNHLQQRTEGYIWGLAYDPATMIADFVVRKTRAV